MTLKDVARLSGVSEISVSRVMRNAPNISDTLRQKVTEAATLLGYTPNRLAGGLKSSSSNLVAVIVPSISNAVFPEVLDGIDSVLAETKYQPVLGITHYDPVREIRVVRDMLAWSPAGVIMVGSDVSPEIREILGLRDIPIIQMMDTDAAPLQISVGISHKRAAREVADFIVARGYCNPGYIGAWAELPQRSRCRRLAYEARLAELGVPLVAHLIRAESSSISLGEFALGELLRTNPDVDAVFFSNDDLAIGAMFHCIRVGRRIPEDVALIGFNGFDMGKSLPIELTTIETPRYIMGVEAARAFLRRKSDPNFSGVTDLGYRLRAGKSA
ncbi:MAG: LacI family DNA-binding transcriptional regulator [Pseudomonadota bacterium]